MNRWVSGALRVEVIGECVGEWVGSQWYLSGSSQPSIVARCWGDDGSRHTRVGLWLVRLWV